jgi:hypothetical protein
LEGYLSRNINLFYSRQLLTQYNISVENPLTIDLSEDLEKRPFSLDIDLQFYIIILILGMLHTSIFRLFIYFGFLRFSGEEIWECSVVLDIFILLFRFFC